jgi:putative component of toxin-antitoxin plasmid stabilization module
VAVNEPDYTLEFYRDANGRQPVLDWLREELDPSKRRALGVAMLYILQQEGVGVCATEYGKPVSKGLFEFRLRHSAQEVLHNIGLLPRDEPRVKSEEEVLLRVYCHAYGSKVILLLAGYDKGEEPAKKREQKEIRLAQGRLKDFEERVARGVYES